jgi:hypothetical protein
MSIIMLILVLAVIGLALYLIETYIPMAPPIKLVIRVIIIIALVLWFLQLFGVVGPTVGHLR